jgi:hypothetical protein
LIAGGTAQRVHRHLDLRGDVPRSERVDFFLQFALPRHDFVFFRVVVLPAPFGPISPKISPS